MWYLKGIIVFIIGIAWILIFGKQYESETDKWRKREYLLLMNDGMIGTLIGITIIVCSAGL